MILGGFGVAMDHRGQGGQNELGGCDVRKWWEKGEGENK